MSNQNKKTIKINPDIFKIHSNTKRNTTNKIRLNHSLSENMLKKKLLNRIKQHKNKENEKQKQNVSLSINNPIKNNEKDEFKESFDYLNKLSKKKIEDKSKTLKNYKFNKEIPQTQMQPQNNEEDIHKYFETNVQQQEIPPLKLKNIEPPWGNLKGGTKPTYKNWVNLTKNINKPETISEMNEKGNSVSKEERIEKIKKKLRDIQKQSLTQNIFSNEIRPVSFVPSFPKKDKDTNQLELNSIEPIFVSSLKSQENNENNFHIQPEPEVIPQPPPIINIEKKFDLQPSPSEKETTNENKETHTMSLPIKQTIQKTIKRKYTLGKNKIKRKVSILLKNNATRKKILESHKKLKSKPLDDVKIYLREHGLIKIGSNAPKDVIRKIYESAMLSGEIVNKNKDILIHNMVET
jgi:hypothetical protein